MLQKHTPSYAVKLQQQNDLNEVFRRLVQPSSIVSVALTVRLLSMFFPKTHKRLVIDGEKSTYCQSEGFVVAKDILAPQERMMDGSRLLVDVLEEFKLVFGEAPRGEPEIIIGAHYRDRNDRIENKSGSGRSSRITPDSFFKCFELVWKSWGLNHERRKKLILLSTDNENVLNETTHPFFEAIKNDNSTTIEVSTKRDTPHWSRNPDTWRRHDIRADTTAEMLGLSMSNFLFKTRSGFSNLAIALSVHLDKKKNVFEMLNTECSGYDSLTIADAK
eukprot:Trichotokara_eunicae@DN6326_c0_g1_i13.p1